jgi:hypothetical protein
MRLLAVCRGAAAALCLLAFGDHLRAQAAPAAPQQVQVTFYSSGSLLKGGLPGYKYGAFTGRIMDEYDQLAMLTPGHFVTFNLDPGPHTLSVNAWLLATPKGGGHVKLNLVPGRHYFIATFLESYLYVSRFRIEERTCEQAQQDNMETTPLDRKHLKSYGQPRVADDSAFPACS